MKAVFVIPLFLVSCASAPKPAAVAGSEVPVAAKTASAQDAKLAPKLATNVQKERMDGLEISCAVTNDDRVLTIVPKGEGCELHYRKHGKSFVVGQSYKQPSFCETLRGKIQKNLEAAGFACHNN